MPLSKNQAGSAVAEFVLLGAPAVLLFVGLLGIVFNSYVDTIARMATLEASRYSSLADVSVADAQLYFANRTKQLLGSLSTTTAIDLLGSEKVMATLTYRPVFSLNAIGLLPVQIRVVSPLENR